MKSMYRKTIALCAVSLLLSAAAFAVTINGTVKNQTTGKPGSGDTVELLSMQQAMSVLASTKTDANGAFHFDVSDPNSPHLIRVNHDGVNYFPAAGPLAPGATSVSIDVYDAANKVEGVATTVDIVRLQTDSQNLSVMELFAIKNDSKPPRSVKGEKTYEFYLPEGAQIDEVLMQPPGGMPVNTSALQQGKSNKYAFNFAIKPGETRFEVAYHLPYSGSASFDPKMMSKVQHFLVMMPKSMTFSPKTGAAYSPMNDPNATVEVATNVTPDSNLGFAVSGTGALQEDQQNANQQGGQSSGGESQGGSAMASGPRPGGGLGPPIDAPDPLHQYRIPILAGFGLVLACGAVFVASRARQQGGTATTPVMGTFRVDDAKPAPAAAPADKTSMLLEGLKDELFQLEVEKQQGRITEAEYESAKAALNQTLKRALARKS